MALAPIFVTTTNYRKKSRPNKKQQRAQAEHEAWLKKQGLHSSQLSAKKKFKETRDVYQPIQKASDQIPGPGFQKSVFLSEWKRDLEDDEMAEREKQALEQARQKARQVAPAFSKGGYQYITPGSDLTELGKKK